MGRYGPSWNVIGKVLVALGLAIAGEVFADSNAQLYDILVLAVLIFVVLFAIPGLIVTWKWLGRASSN